jgi:tripartite-type tricarboxylate transporter receptor subunit TctC
MNRVITRAASLAAGIAAALIAFAPPALAQDWPNKSVSILVPTAAGGNTDLMARLAAEYLNKKFGQPFVVQNRPSAGGVLTSQQVGTADPDGYTMLFAPNSMILLTPLVQAVSFEPDQILVPVTNVGTGSQVLAIRASLPPKNLAGLFAYAKDNPGKLNVAYAGANNISHLGPILLFKRAGVDIVMVPARGEPQSITDLLAGSVDVYFGNASVLLNTDREKIRLLAVGTAKRIAAAPELPTITESMPGFEFASWNGFFVPVKTPGEVMVKLQAAIAELVSTPEMKKRLIDLGIVPGGQTNDEVTATFKKDRASFAEAVKVAGVKKP